MNSIPTNIFYKKSNKPKVVIIPDGDVSEADLDSDVDDSEELVTRSSKFSRLSSAGPSRATKIVLPLELEGDGDGDWQPDAEEHSDDTDTEEHGEPNISTPRNQVPYTLRWINKDIDTPDTTFLGQQFSDPGADMTPLEYFKTYFDDSIISNMSYQTNLYSVQKSGQSVNTNPNEMEQFIGIHVISGIVSMPSYRQYWADNTRFPQVADVMARNRFDKLRTYVHLNDNEKMLPRENPSFDKLYKVRPLIDKVKENMKKVEPEEYNSIDEIMIPFKGKSSLKQYVRNKPHKWGIKVFARAGASGILYDFEIYIGKGTTTGTKTDLGISGDIVMRLVEGLPNHQNYKISFDNWFASFALVAALKDIGMWAVGTIRINRVPGCFFKTDSVMKKEGRGSAEYKTERGSNIITLKWYDNKSVHVISSYAGYEPAEEVRRWSTATKSYINVPRPLAVKEYNFFMGGVDLHDMLVELYRVDIKGKRYYLRILFHIVDMCIVNSWLLYRRHCKLKNVKHNPLVTFRAEIAHALLLAGKTQRKRGRLSSLEKMENNAKQRCRQPRIVDDVRYDGVAHWPIPMNKKSRCKLCIKAHSRMSCEKCNVSLCLIQDRNCFRLFHLR